jgi:hypothetical protein
VVVIVLNDERAFVNRIIEAIDSKLLGVTLCRAQGPECERAFATENVSQRVLCGER